MISVNRLFRVLPLVGIVAFAGSLSASAQLPSSPRGGVADRLTPPIPLGNTHPVLVAAFPDTIYAAFIAVDVDASGKADLATLTLTGSAADLNSKSITDWLRKTIFKPAMRNGVPMRSTFRVTLETWKQADPDSTAAPKQ